MSNLIRKATGFREWRRPSEFRRLRFWLLSAWNEYDDWLYNGVHGFIILGFEFDNYPRWTSWLWWRALPVIRFVNRRPERV